MSYHVLVVEDDVVTRSKLVGYFQNEGYTVSEAESGAQMRSVLEESRRGLVRGSTQAYVMLLISAGKWRPPQRRTRRTTLPRLS